MDPLELSEATQSALNEFLREQQREKENLANKDPFTEDWGLSQVKPEFSSNFAEHIDCTIWEA